MSVIEFGDGREPWSIGRHKVRRWLYCIVRQVDALPDVWRDELAAWLAEHGAESGPSLLVTRDDSGGHCVHFTGAALDVELTDLPTWLQRPEPEPARPARRRAKGHRRRGAG